MSGPAVRPHISPCRERGPERNRYSSGSPPIRAKGRRWVRVEDTAEFRIRKAIVDNSRALNLRGLGIRELPGELDYISGLESLDLADNMLGAFPERLLHHRRLRTLDLSGNGITRLGDEISELPELASLDLSRNDLTAIPEAIGKLGKLRRLDLHRNALTTLPDVLGDLRQLQELELSYNSLAALPDALGRLTGLRSLYADSNRLVEVPDALGLISTLSVLGLEGNPRLRNPPPEVLAAGTQGVLQFLKALAAGATVQWSSKMLVVGEAAVGKTSVSNLLCGIPYNRDEPQTHGVHVDSLQLPHPGNPGASMNLSVWDFGGQLEYRATQRFYLTDRSLFLLVWNSRRGWRTGGQVEAWLQAITNAAPTSPVIIVATHCTDSVDDLDAEDLRRRHPNIAATVRVDCKDASGIAELRDLVALHSAALPLMGARWPTTWAAGAAALYALRETYTTIGHTHDVLSAQGVPSADHAILMAALNDQGRILHLARDPQLAELVVLKPAWIDAMITRVLDSQQITDRGGLLSTAHRAELWRDLADPGIADLLTAMMERFDLAYRIDAPGYGEAALVVERLPSGTPARLPDGWSEALLEPGASEIHLNYRLPSRQAGIPSWFIARMHRFTTSTAWARGVLLRHRGAPIDAWALLVDDDQAQPTLRLTVRGQAPHAFLSTLDDAFTRILNERYPGLALTRHVPCTCRPNCAQEFDYAVAVTALKGGHQLQCQNTFTMLDPRTLLLGLRTPPQEEALVRIEAKLDGVSAQMREAQLRILDLVRDLLHFRGEQGTHCPSIFTLTRSEPENRARRFLGRANPATSYELRLYCEHPDAPHPLPDNAGVYTLTSIPQWLRNYAPYLRVLLNALKTGLPLLGPTLEGVLGQTLSEATKAQLELSCGLLDDLRTLRLPADRFDRRLGSNVDFRVLRKSLIRIDPEFGGLRERELPENRGIVYLCAEHREALHYPARPGS